MGMRTSREFYEWAFNNSGLQTPKKKLEAKGGKGIFRRFYYWVPLQGVRALDRSRLPAFKADKGAWRLHEFADIGRPGTLHVRSAAYHMCDSCWEGRVLCENLKYTGGVQEISVTLRRSRRGARLASAARRRLCDECAGSNGG
mmetsp:Transcript_22091/g.59590  ORF Transcript_22091/g.59590 Transcript_22091/m.59590 type:complete len:143 (-) Transcript_22091:909-1337(-)